MNDIDFRSVLTLRCTDNRSHLLQHAQGFTGPSEQHCIDQAQAEGWRIETESRKAVCPNCVRATSTKEQ